MKVKDHPNYSEVYPEYYPWGTVDSRTAAEVAIVIAEDVRVDVGNDPHNRTVTPGLRRALNIIAERVEA